MQSGILRSGRRPRGNTLGAVDPPSEKWLAQRHRSSAAPRAVAVVPTIVVAVVPTVVVAVVVVVAEGGADPVTGGMAGDGAVGLVTVPGVGRGHAHDTNQRNGQRRREGELDT